MHVRVRLPHVRYEMRAECGSTTTAAAATPDAAFFFADRLLAVDHVTDAVYALALYEPASASSSTAETAAAAWLNATHAAVSEVRSLSVGSARMKEGLYLCYAKAEAKP